MELQKVSLEGLSGPEYLSFFINTYNILMIHGAIEYGPPTDALSRRSFFHKVSYVIDGNPVIIILISLKIKFINIL